MRQFLIGCSVCQFCNRRGNAVLLAASAFYRIEIDFQGPYPNTKNRNTFIAYQIFLDSLLTKLWQILYKGP